MPTINIYQKSGAETSPARKWFFRALIASLVIHALLFAAFRSTKLEHFSPYTERLVPRAFTSLGRVDIDPKLLSDEPEKPRDAPNSQQPAPSITVPDEKPAADAIPQEMVYKPTAPDIVKPIVSENPKVAADDMKTLEKMQQNVSKDIDNDLSKLSEQLIKDKTTSSKSYLKFAENTKSSAAGNPAAQGDSGIPGTKSLDAALAGTGGLQNGDKIGIPGGALFNEDSAELRPEAMTDLKKLERIVQLYPDAIFSINGYADSFGTAEYNLDLSQRRADAVKSWLLLVVKVNPARIIATGYGSTNFVVSPSGTVDEQEKNRRVEIAVKFSK